MWFVPVLFAIGAIVLSTASILVDDHTRVWTAWLPGMSPGSAETISATIASGMIAFTGVVFATTLVAIQLAGGQYSPRVVRIFVRSQVTHVTLGIFLAAAVFALNVLTHTREGGHGHVPNISLAIPYMMMLATL